MIRIECPECEKVFRIDEERAGSKATCPECGHRFRIPEDSDEPKAAITTQKSRPRPPAEEADEDDRPRPRRKWHFDATPYQPDGGVTGLGVVLMLAVEGIAGLLLGLLSGFVGHWFYLVLLFPILIGAGLGGAGVLGIRLGKVRNPVVGGLIGFFGGCVASPTALFVEYMFFLHERTENRRELEAAANWRPGMGGMPGGDPTLARQILGVKSFFGYIDFSAQQGMTISGTSSTDKGMNLGYVGTYIYWLVEFLIMAGIAFAIMRKGTMHPYCTVCQSWKQDHQLGGLRGPPWAAQAAVEDGKLDHLEDHEPSTKPRGEMRLHVAVCPNCGDDSPIEVRLVQMVKAQGRDQPKDLTHVTYPGKALDALEELFPGTKIGTSAD